MAWYREVREEGHPDIRDGWIELRDAASLVQILATMAWVGSAHHAAVNFGQYSYSGYMVGGTCFSTRTANGGPCVPGRGHGACGAGHLLHLYISVHHSIVSLKVCFH